ncbi:Hsp20/alpha crystallin family protein [Pontibacter silvestris]|uniref:Hsp20/alpha crystallin family protein n=1 Tax=Pontibacter silvestris TaxID=2305183 RepID=A0ABW4WV69_9BACT|nr:Hsp20/alpha crystallin family protein [Pontibacter silvestris]MCC9137194.1 Hsp20/alpha crystallin family protein [Pontibacter silvestris]
MALVRNNGFYDVMPQSFSTMLDRFFNESVNTRNFSGFTPHVDACETEKGFELELALPGVKKEDVSIDFQEGKLTITGERKFEKKEEGKRYHMLETQYGSFTRTFYLPDNVNPEQIKANLANGVLHVTVPKDEQKVLKRQISITSDAEEETKPAAKKVAVASENGKEVKA